MDHDSTHTIIQCEQTFMKEKGTAGRGQRVFWFSVFIFTLLFYSLDVYNRGSTVCSSPAMTLVLFFEF